MSKIIPGHVNLIHLYLKPFKIKDDIMKLTWIRKDDILEV